MSKAIEINDPFRRLHEINPDLYEFAHSFTWTDHEKELIRQLPFNRTSQEANFKLIFDFRMMIENKRTAELERDNSRRTTTNMKIIELLTFGIAAAAVAQAVFTVLTFLKLK